MLSAPLHECSEGLLRKAGARFIKGFQMPGYLCKVPENAREGIGELERRRLYTQGTEDMRMTAFREDMAGQVQDYR